MGSESKKQAAVYCVIIGFSVQKGNYKKLFINLNYSPLYGESGSKSHSYCV